MSAIKAGDLVVVIRARPCCGVGNHVGRPYRVVALDRYVGQCSECGAPVDYTRARSPVDVGYNVARLQKIGPLTEPESVERDTEVTA